MSIILGLLFIHTLIHFLTKHKSNVLTCGLFCYCGKETSDPFKMRILAIFNQSRGDHSTGICIDDVIIKDTVPAKEFLLKHSETFNYRNYALANTSMLGHCRLATFAFDKHRIAYAHPHKANKDGSDFLRLVHNGTISNYADLADKYDISTVDKTDSMVIAEILAKAWDTKFNFMDNKHPLQEYDGAATVIFYPITMKNTLFVHRDFARELYYWQETPSSMYISSIKESLMILGAKPESVHEFPSGVLHKIVNGKVVKKWPFTVKSPYKLPAKITPPYKHVDKYDSARNSRVRASYPAGVVSMKAKKDGFHNIDHLITFNGHDYTGHMYVEIDGPRVVRDPMDSEKYLFRKYFVICGVVMKNETCYDKLYTKCSKDGVFDVGQFKKILTSTLQEYALYPVAGKKFHDDKIIVWSDRLPDCKTKDDTISWIPLLSKIKYSANRAGFITKEEVLEPKSILSFVEVIELLISERMESKHYYQGAMVLYDDYIRMADDNMPFYQFMTKLITFFKSCSTIPRDMIEELEDADLSEDCSDKHSSLPDLLAKTLKIYQVIAPMKVANDDEIDDDQITAEDVDKCVDGDGDWDTQSFKNNVLFEDFETLQELTDNFAPSTSDNHRNKFYHALGKVLRDIGYISADTLYEIRTAPVDVNQVKLGKIYTDFRQEKCLSLITEVLQDGNTTEGFANLYNRYDVLDQKYSKTKKDELTHTILKLGLAYLLTRVNKNLDRKKLLADYNITPRELDTISPC